jgi:SurA N-terminal domain
MELAMSRWKRWVGVGSLGLLLLTGCSKDQPASAAATVGPDQVPLDEISDQLHDLNEVLGAPVGAVDPQLTNAVVRNNVVYRLVDLASAEAGVTVTQTEIDQRLASQVAFVGSRELLNRQAATSGVAPDLVETDIRTALQAQALQEKLTAGLGLDDQAQQQALVASIQAYSNQIGVTVNPRFGVWEVDTLSIVVDQDAPSASPDQIELSQVP